MGIATYSFKEICDKTNYKPSVIRYYEKEFKINIPRDVNGRRIFTQKEYEKLMTIKKLQAQGYNNTQIKKIIEEKKQEVINEIALTNELPENKTNNDSNALNNELFKALDVKLSLINNSLDIINQNVNGKERDVLLSENLKLKMELKQKAYEIIELKDKLMCAKERKGKFIEKLFSK